MMNSSIVGKRLSLSLLLLVGGCGGDGSSTGPTSAPAGSIPPPGISASGTVTGFGSVFVNGVKFKTSSTTKIFDDDADDGAAITDNDLKVGDVVEVKGISEDAGNATAQIMEMAAEVRGPVDRVFDPTAKTVVVMGQTVLIDNNTAIDNNVGLKGIVDLKVADLVDVHGFRDPTGIVVATRIERQGAVAKFRVRGTISGFNSAAQTFKIGALTVAYGSAQIVPTGTVLADGLRVRTKAETAPVGGRLSATKVKVKKAEDSDKEEVEGVINKFASVTDFEVNGLKMTTDSNTRYEHGTAADIKEGVKVEIAGATRNNVLRASKIELKAGGDNKRSNSASTQFAGLVADMSLANKTITVFGQKFTVTAATMFEDGVNNTRPFNIVNFDSVVKIAAHVQISAFKDGAGLTATRIELNNKSDLFVQGALEAGATAARLVIGGVEVAIDTGTRFSMDDASLVDFAAFQAKAPAGSIVKAKATAVASPTDTKINAIGARGGQVEIAN